MEYEQIPFFPILPTQLMAIAIQSDILAMTHP